MYQLYCRTFQTIFRIASPLLPWRTPQLLQGEKSFADLAGFLKKEGIERVLIVTDQGVRSLGLLDQLLLGLDEMQIPVVIYDKTTPNPTIDNIEEALKLYHENKCKGIIAVGGGSSMDCGKGVAARAARPNKSIRQMKGLFKVLKKVPPLIAVPTTAGTGSEATVAAVITDSRTHEKYPINDFPLIPKYAVLDPLLTVGLPPHLTATTGMDALTHAVEAYIGRSNTKETLDYSRKAVTLIFNNLYEAYSNGTNLTARANMQIASYYAGIAFTRAYVGNVHAIAHTLGGLYSIPHGLANSVILPYVLEYYGEAAHESLSSLADLVGIGGIVNSNAEDTKEQKSKAEKAALFIQAIRQLNQSMKIPEKLAGIKDEDIPLMVSRALKEANPLYPVPVIFSRKDMTNLYHMIQEPDYKEA